MAGTRRPKKEKVGSVKLRTLREMGQVKLPAKFFRCSRCGTGMMSEGSCRRKNRTGYPICHGWGEEVQVVRARCKCAIWLIRESELLTRCEDCHRRLERVHDPSSDNHD